MENVRYRVRLAALLLATCFAGAGCYDPKEVNAFLQEPRLPVSGLEYRIYPPDVISVGSIHIPEINRVRQQVRPDGKINLPLVGEVMVAGLTPKEVEKAITALAKDYYEEVDATVDIVAYRSQNYYVIGQVAASGPKPWTGRDTLLDALAAARLTTLAWPQRVTVVRGREPKVGGYATTQPGKRFKRTGVHRPAEGEEGPKKMTVNLMAMVKSGDLSHNIILLPNDVIYVQPNPLAAVGLAVQNLLFPIRSATEAVSAPVRAATVMP